MLNTLLDGAYDATAPSFVLAFALMFQASFKSNYFIFLKGFAKITVCVSHNRLGLLLAMLDLGDTR